MNYKLVDSDDVLIEGIFMHETSNLIEVHTGLVIKTSVKKDEGRSLLRHLNMGGGFDGFTPAFFCEIIKRKEV
jgi:hypothetical protein